MWGDARVDWQRQVGEDFAEEEPRAAVPVEQVGVLADPAEAGIAGEGFLEDRRTVGECAITRGAGRGRDALRESREPAADHLVIVAADGVTGDVPKHRVGEHRPWISAARPVIHACGDDPHRARHEFRRSRPPGAVAPHVLHLALAASCQPLEQVLFVGRQLGCSDADLLEAEFLAPGLDLLGERSEIHAWCDASAGGGGARPV